MMVGATLREAAAWWARQMRGLLPTRLLPDAWRGDVLVMEASGPSEAPQIRLKQRRRQREMHLADIGLDDTRHHAPGAPQLRPGEQVVLRPSEGTVLQRKVALPLVAEHDMQRVLGYEMDRLTPFTADQVYWSAIVERRNRDAGHLELLLLLVPKFLIQPAIAAAAKLGLSVSAIETTAADGSVRHIALAAASVRRQRILPVVWGTTAILATAAILTPFVTQSIAFGAIDGQIAALQPRIAQVEALRKRIAEGSAGNDVIAAEHAATGDALQVVATITDLLPDDTVLADLSLRRGKISIAGRTRSAPQLIPAMAGDPILHNPSFAAPVTRTPDGKADTFVIRAELNP